MTIAESRTNNFSSLRLVFAVLVIVAHTPEIIDGNRSRELLTMAFGTMSFGQLAVDGFFLISGYLITKSLINTPSLKVFFLNRVARIVPGFLVAFWLCVIALAPFVSGEPIFTFDVLSKAVIRSLSLGSPQAPGVFAALPYPHLNIPMWTIRWEFICYTTAAALSVVGFLTANRRVFVLAGTAVFLVANILQLALHYENLMIGLAIRLPSVFMTGALFYLYREKITYRGSTAAISTVALLVCMFFLPLAEVAFTVLGGYLIFWFAFKVPATEISGLANRFDISYGLYLYAWPIGSALVLAFPDGNPWLIGITTVSVAAVFGLASWLVIERPALNAAKKWRDCQITLTPPPVANLENAVRASDPSA